MDIYIQTWSGHSFNIGNPSDDENRIYLADIVFGLDQINRFNGATASGTISVLEHSLLVSNLVDWQARPYALLHDAHEAYIGDITTPVALALKAKDHLDALKLALDGLIWQAFGLEPPDHDVRRQVREADRLALWIERKTLMQPGPDRGWPQVEVTKAQEEHLRWLLLRSLTGGYYPGRRQFVEDAKAYCRPPQIAPEGVEVAW